MPPSYEAREGASGNRGPDPRWEFSVAPTPHPHRKPRQAAGRVELGWGWPATLLFPPQEEGALAAGGGLPACKVSVPPLGTA